MPIIVREFNTDLKRWANTIFPFPNPSRYGSKNSSDLGDIVSAAQIQMMGLQDFYEF